MSTLFELERMERIVQDLKTLRCPVTFPVVNYKMADGKLENGQSCSTADWDNFKIDTVWSAVDAHRWLRTAIEIPEEMDHRHVEFEMITGREGGWDGTNPQMLFYLNGNLIQGMDINHREVTISQEARAGDRYEIAILCYSGLIPGDLSLHTNLIAVDDAVEKLYYDFMIPLQSAGVLQGSDPENSRKILQKLDAAANAVDLRKPYSEEFYRSVQKADKVLVKEFYTKTDENAPVVTAIGHTHIDIAWQWTVAQTREKALRSFSTVLRLMEQYPEYKFMSSQPVLYQFVKEQAPQTFEKIRQRVREGRWEPDGAMWLEADCNLPCGESLVRQVMKGEKFFRDEFGVSSQTLWLPDVFGYSAALPQILKKAGISHFMTTKISWNQSNQLPNDTFMWRGLDGSEVFVFMPTACNFDTLKAPAAGTVNTATYNGTISPSMILGTYKRFQNRDLTENTIILFGYGDGGGGPSKEMLESAERLKYGIPGIPRIELASERDFFRDTCREISHLPQMPRWEGELYFENHRGTLTSMAKNKRNNRKNEILYEQIETMASMLKEQSVTYPKKEISRGWDVLLLNQFHDIVPGSSIEQVYEQTDREYAEISETGKRVLGNLAQQGAGGIATDDHAIVVYNTLGYDRSDVVHLDSSKALNICCIQDENGQKLPFQHTADGEALFYAEKIPMLGHKVFYYTEGKTEESPKDWDGRFENSFYCVTFNRSMEITSLVEKQTGKEMIPEGARANEIVTYEDRPMNWDNWNIDRYYQKKPYYVDEESDVRVIENGDVRKTLEIKKRFSDSVLVQKIHLYHDLPRIDFETHVDWQNHHVLLRVNFPVNVNASKAAFEIQFGNVERQTTNNTSWDSAQFETCGHKWADLSEGNNGVSLLNDCKYGYGVKNGNLSLTLIKSGTYPNKNADIGHHDFVYSIYPHAGRWQEARTVEMAYDLNVPLIPVLQDRNVGTVSGCESFMRCDSENCFVEVIKQAENGEGRILRMYENQNKYTPTVLTFRDRISAAYECSLLEKNEKELPVKENTVNLVFKPFEIKTIRIV